MERLRRLPHLRRIGHHQRQRTAAEPLGRDQLHQRFGRLCDEPGAFRAWTSGHRPGRPWQPCQPGGVCHAPKTPLRTKRPSSRAVDIRIGRRASGSVGRPQNATTSRSYLSVAATSGGAVSQLLQSLLARIGAFFLISATDVVARRLQNLDLTNNSLTGTIPSSLGGLAKLKTLDLSDNAGVVLSTGKSIDLKKLGLELGVALGSSSAIVLAIVLCTVRRRRHRLQKVAALVRGASVPGHIPLYGVELRSKTATGALVWHRGGVGAASTEAGDMCVQDPASRLHKLLLRTGCCGTRAGVWSEKPEGRRGSHPPRAAAARR